MIKTTILIFFSFALTACQPNSLQTSNANDKKYSVEIKAQSDEKRCLEQVQLLNQLYKSKFSIENASEKQLAEYFDAKLATLILQDEKCSDENGICNIEFNIFSDSQDPQFDRYDIARTNSDSQYLVTLFNPTDQTKIVYELNNTVCPKISNIHYSNGSDLIEILSRDELF